MRDLLIRAILDEPFNRFVVRLFGGYELRVTHPELITYIPGVEEFVVYDQQGFSDIFHAHHIVSLRREGGPA